MLEAVPFGVLNSISARRIRTGKAGTVLVSLSLALAIASSFLVTAMTKVMVWDVRERVVASNMPFDAAVLFSSEEECLLFYEERGRVLNEMAEVKLFPFAVVPGLEGDETVLGIGREVPEGTKLPAGLITGEPSEVEKLGGDKAGLRLDFLGDLHDSIERLERMLRYYSDPLFLYPGRGSSMIQAAAFKSFSIWHVVSLAAAVTASAAITCVLTVAFFGRKRTLGMLKILGSTNRDLRRLLLIETSYMGAIGFPVGIAIGATIVSAWFGSSAITLACFLVSGLAGLITLAVGVWFPMRLVRDATCNELLNESPMHAL